MSAYTKPLPLITETSKVFYDGCKRGELLYQFCQTCDEVIWLPKQFCPKCMSRDLEWKPSTGKGKIYMFTVTSDFCPPQFMEDLPYAVAVIRMDEGYKMMSNIVECDFDALRIDMPVEVVFEPVTEEITLPKFRPVSEGK